MSAQIIRVNFHRSRSTDRLLRSLRKLDAAVHGSEAAARMAEERANLLEKLSASMAGDYRVAIQVETSSQRIKITGVE